MLQWCLSHLDVTLHPVGLMSTLAPLPPQIDFLLLCVVVRVIPGNAALLMCPNIPWKEVLLISSILQMRKCVAREEADCPQQSVTTVACI